MMSLALKPAEYRDEDRWVKLDEKYFKSLDKDKLTTSSEKCFYDHTYREMPVDPYLLYWLEKGYNEDEFSYWMDRGISPPPNLIHHSLLGGLIDMINELWVSVKILLAYTFCFNSQLRKEIGKCVNLRAHCLAHTTRYFEGSFFSKRFFTIERGNMNRSDYYEFARPMIEVVRLLDPEIPSYRAINLVHMIGICRDHHPSRGHSPTPHADFCAWDYQSERGQAMVRKLSQTVDAHIPELAYETQLYYDAFFRHAESFSNLRKGIASNPELVEASEKVKSAIKPFLEVVEEYDDLLFASELKSN